MKGLGLAVAAAMVLALACSAPARAQSLYSLHGFGEEVITLPAKQRALGATSAASRTAGVFGNPALLTFADRTTFTGSFVLDWIQTEEPARPEAGERQDYSSAVTNLSILFPLGQTTLGIGLLFDRRINGTIQADATVGGQPYTQIFDRDGNLLRFPAHLATNWGGLRVGGGIDVILFSARASFANVFPIDSGFASSSDVDRATLWTIEPRVGVLRPLAKGFTVGAWGAWPRELRGTRFLESDDPEDDSEDIEIHVEQDLPPRVTGAVEKQFSHRFRMAFDWTYEAWGSIDAALSPDEFEDVNCFALGAEWSHEGAKGIARLPLRAGLRTQTLHALDANGNQVREVLATLGSGLGFSGGNGQFDWSVEYGRRGSDDDEFKETFWRFAVTLAGYEKWSGRRGPEED